MAFSSEIQLFAALLFLTLATSVIGHSYVTSPISRANQAQTLTGCRGPACLGPCEVPLSKKIRAPLTAMRGDTITVKWPRNNHAGGFIRFAWAPTSLSDNHAAFDAHVQQINCHETGGCFPDDSSNPNGGDSGPSDGSSRACSSVLTVPLDLTDGEWTLQWAWFGGAFALGDYYSCVDYKIAGGANGTLIPKFVGGDYAYPGQQKCKFFNTDKLHVCVNEPCNTGIYPYSQQQSGAPADGQLGFIPTPTPVTTASVNPMTTAAMQVPVTPTPVTTAAVQVPVTPTPVTTAAMQVPVTTAAVLSMTTAAMSVPVTPTPVTTAAVLSMTTAAVPVTPMTTSAMPVAPSPVTPSPVAPTPTDNTGCVLGNQICVGDHQYRTCTNARVGTEWAAPQSCQIGLSCHRSDTGNNIYCY